MLKFGRFLLDFSFFSCIYVFFFVPLPAIYKYIRYEKDSIFLGGYRSRSDDLLC